jgi:Niemann-Pick C1 protein
MKLKLDFLSERSIPDELVVESSQNTAIVGLSYLLMFLYVSISIGYFPNPVYSRFSLGFMGIVIVICSLVIAVGITFYWLIPLTMISSEVVPFLVLAIGVDNMFIITRAERQVDPAITRMDIRVGLALKSVGASIFTAAFCEALAFFVGMLTTIPALTSFCLVAGIAVLVNFCLQITAFAAVLALDGRRIQNN